MAEIRLHSAGVAVDQPPPEIRLHAAGITAEEPAATRELRLHRAGLTIGVAPPVGPGGSFVYDATASRWVKQATFKVVQSGQFR